MKLGIHVIMVSDIWLRTIQTMREETCCNHSWVILSNEEQLFFPMRSKRYFIYTNVYIRATQKIDKNCGLDKV